MKTRKFFLRIQFSLLACTALPLAAQTNTFPSSGPVGVGTTTPFANLAVVGNLGAGSTATAGIGTSLALLNANSTDAGLYLYRSVNQWADTWWQWTIGGDNRLRLGFSTVPQGEFSNGSAAFLGVVGIGTTAPAGKLDVSGIPDGTSVFFRSVGRPFLDIKGGTNSYKTLRFSNVGSDADYRWDLNVLPGNDATNPDGLGWWSVSGGQVFTLKANGNVGIGTPNPTQKLSVNGTIRAKEVIVDTGWSDYVFKPDYRLAPLSEVEGAIQKDGHLPGIPSASEVAKHGISVGEMQAKLLAKIEELTLHVIAQQKQIEAQQGEIRSLQQAIAR